MKLDRLNSIPYCINGFFTALKCHRQQYFKTKFEEFISCFNNHISSLQKLSGNFNPLKMELVVSFSHIQLAKVGNTRFCSY